MGCCSPAVKTGLLMGFGAVAVVVGAVMVVFWPPLFTTQLQKMMVLTNESMSFDIWRETPIPMYLEIHLFNISNVDEILAKKPGVRLKVQEIGPYVFRELHIKTNLTWNDHNNTITFYNQRWWHFQPDRSVGLLSDKITSVNPVIATIGYIMRHASFPIKIGANAFMNRYHSNMFVTANVSSWVFDGLVDPLLEAAEKLPDLPIEIPYDRFGWFYERNGSTEFDGSFNMNTGAGDFSDLGNVHMWQYSNRTHFKDECGVVKGSTGELWAPEYGQEEVFIFSSDLCSFLILGKDSDVTIQGVEGVQYAANKETFDNGHNFPRMACFCDGPTSSPECVPAGALNMSACRYGAPAFVSLPHFLLADPHYPSKVDGLDPNDNMRFRLVLEMFTGMPLAVTAQLQINLLIRHVTWIPINNALPDGDTMVPMMWFRQELELTPEYAALARFALRMRYWIPYGMYALTAVGVVLIIAGIAYLLRRLLKSPDTTPILAEEEVPVQT